MDFNSLVLDILNESPDSLEFEGKEYHYDELKGNPITFVIDELMVVNDTENPWNEEKDEPNSYDSGLGLVVIYGKSSKEKKTTWSHTKMLEDLMALEYPYAQSNQHDLYFFPTEAEQKLNELAKQHPRMAVYAKGTVETIPPTQLGRMWKIGDKVVVSIWDEESDMVERFVVPLVNKIYPDVPADKIMIEDQMTDTFYPSSKISKDKVEKKPHEKELAELQRQLHLASGDKQKKNEIVRKIVEICKQHGINPEKYGISDEVLKGSQLTAQKVLGKSEEPMASLKARMQTSESFKGQTTL